MHKEPDLVTDLLIWMAYADSECPFLFTKVKPDLGPAHLKLHDAVKELGGDKVCIHSCVMITRCTRCTCNLLPQEPYSICNGVRI